MKCIYCGNEIRKESKEHIILASLGGDLYSTNLICKTCNNNFSNSEYENIDENLSKEFVLFINMLNIKNDNNRKVPTIKPFATIDGRPISLKPGGIPEYSKVMINHKNEKIQIISSDRGKSEEMITNLLKQHDGEIIIENKEEGEIFIKKPLERLFTMDTNTFRAISKALLNFSYYIKRDEKKEIINDTSILKNITEFIKYKTFSSNTCCGFDGINITNKFLDFENLSHKLYLFGNQKKRIIFGYYIIFGCISFSCILSNGYNEKDFGFYYETSPLIKSNKFTEIDLDKSFDDKFIIQYAEYQNIHQEKMGERLKELLKHSEYHSQNKIIMDKINTYLNENENDFYNNIQIPTIRNKHCQNIMKIKTDYNTMTT